MTRASIALASAALTSAIAFPVAIRAQAIRIGAEFQVNTHTSSNQLLATLAADADGDFIVAWQSLDQDGSGLGVFARRLSSAGTPNGSDFQVNTYTVDDQWNPAVATDSVGNFVVVWDTYGSDQDGSNRGIFGQRFSSAGITRGDSFQVNTYTSDIQALPSVAADVDGDFVVAWASDGDLANIFGQDGSDRGVFSQRFSSDGMPIGGEFQVNTRTAASQALQHLAVDADGDLVVAWSSSLQDGFETGIFAQRFSSAGAALGGEFQVNTYTTNIQVEPSVAADDDGDFVVVWYSVGQDGSDGGVFARRFSSAGIPLGGEVQVNIFTTNDQSLPSVAADGEGDFIVTWASFGQDGDGSGIFARPFSSAGVPLDGELQVNTHTSSHQRFPQVAVDANHHFVVVWTSLFQDGSGDGIFAQRLALLVELDIDGDGSTDPLTDGVLVLRFLFELTGGTMITDAVGAECTRCDPDAIAAYLDALGLILDIDGDGTLGALTDGLLALRFLFGLTGEALTSSAVGGGCTRCDVATIGPYLTALDN
jgi:hypothetical protein